MLDPDWLRRFEQDRQRRREEEARGLEELRRSARSAERLAIMLVMLALFAVTMLVRWALLTLEAR